MGIRCRNIFGKRQAIGIKWPGERMVFPAGELKKNNVWGRGQLIFADLPDFLLDHSQV